MNPTDELLEPALDLGINAAQIGDYLRGKLPGSEGPLEIKQFRGGNANLIYLLRYSDAQYVLRRPPVGRLAPGSHDMKREYKVLSRLPRRYPLAPQAFMLSNEPDLIGAPFLVMEYRPGIVIRRDLPSVLATDQDACRRLGNTILSALSSLHAVDPEAAGLGDLGKPDGYLLRQLDGWGRRWEAVSEGPHPDVEHILKWLSDNLPNSASVTLLHNDFKLDNMLLDPDDPTRCIAVVDWDMCTRGDPLVELGFLLNYWGEASDPEEWLKAASMPTWHQGFPSRQEAIAEYIAHTGAKVEALPWHRVFGAFKLAVILQQIWGRFLRGESTNPRFENFGWRVDTLLSKSRQLIAAA